MRRSDIVAIREWRFKTTGEPVMWRSDGRGDWRSRQIVGTGFKGLDVFKGGDVNGDGRPDLVSRVNSTGKLMAHLGDGKGNWIERITLASSGWADEMIAGVGDFDRDGYADLIVRTSDGRLAHYEGSSSGAITRQSVFGRGWDGMRQIL